MAVVFLLRGLWFPGALVGVSVIGFAVSVIYARTGRAGDLTRVNALELHDERDRGIAVHAFAVVGVAALVVNFGGILVIALTAQSGGVALVLAAEALVLSAVWSIANWYYARRM